MPVSQTEAAEALRDISTTERRSFSAYGYKSAAPQLILWGVLWFLGYSGTYLVPPYTNWIWLAVAVFGAIASTILGIRGKPRGQQKFSWRIFFSWLAALTFISSVLSIFSPFNGKQIGTLFPLFIGWAYVVLGIWMGWRFAIAGLVIVALALFGYFHLAPNLFLLWMAFLGGGVLIGTGLWLRHA
jgi:magnesium-transporting ATPase (P-type)